MLADASVLLGHERDLRYYEHRGGPPGFVFYITVEVTHRCNLQCRHCHIGANGRAEDMDTAEALRLFDQAAALGVRRVYFTGGEPTVHPDLLRMMAAVTQRGMELGLISNGFSLDRGLARELKEVGVKVVAVSLLRSDAKAFDDFTRTPGAFAAAARALASLKEVGVPRVVMLTIGSQVGLPDGEIDRLIDLATSLGVELGDERMMPIGRAAEAQHPLISDKARYYQYCSHLQQKRQEMQGRTPISSADPLWFLIDPNGPFSFRGQDSVPDRTAPFCVAGWHMAITPNLDVKPCAFLHIRAGSLRTESLDHIWHEAPVMRAIRCKDNLKGKCRRCEFRHQCGGCRSTAYSITGDLFAEDPLCWREV